MRIRTALLALMVIALQLSTVAQAADERRVALVIGNAAYQQGPLANPVNDARAMTAKLTAMGFDVIERQNLTIKQISATLKEFRSRLNPGTEAVFFYAGHGLQVKGVNYLPAVDADINAEEDVPYQSINVSQILELMEESKTRLNLIFLDACRNNPFSRRFRSAADGLAKVNAPSGTLISFATRPGSVAADGAGLNGLYTEQLLLAMDQANLAIESVLKNTAAGVKRASRGQQEPWSEGMIEGEFFFYTGTKAATKQPTGAPNAKPDPKRETEVWNHVKDSNNIDLLNEYIKSYPKGRFVAQARILVIQIKKNAVLPAHLQSTPAAPAAAQPVLAPVDKNEDALWAEVKSSNTADDYDAYLAEYPQGKFAALAKVRIKWFKDEAAEAARKEQELWQQAEAGNTAEDLQAYLDKYPDGNRAKEARKKLAATRKGLELLGSWVLRETRKFSDGKPYEWEEHWIFNSQSVATNRQRWLTVDVTKTCRYTVSGNTIATKDCRWSHQQPGNYDQTLTYSISGNRLILDTLTFTKM
jgi:uncharacterized caspase-like protein